MDFNELSKEIHENAVKHGFYEDNPSDEHLLCLAICELAEAVEADRNDRHARRGMFEALMEDEDDKDQQMRWFEDYIKDTVEDEIADAMIRLLDLSAHLRYNLEHHRFNFVLNRKATFSENIFSAIKALANFAPPGFGGLCYAYRMLLNIADIIGMDLEWHITEKMKYNQSRPKRHGKKY